MFGKFKQQIEELNKKIEGLENQVKFLLKYDKSEIVVRLEKKPSFFCFSDVEYVIKYVYYGSFHQIKTKIPIHSIIVNIENNPKDRYAIIHTNVYGSGRYYQIDKETEEIAEVTEIIMKQKQSSNTNPKKTTKRKKK